MRAQVVVGVSTMTMTITVLLAGCDNGIHATRAAATLPTPRAGLWRESMLRDGHELGLIGEVRACLDTDAHARLSTLGGRAAKSMCHDHATTRDGDGAYHFSSACDLGPGGHVVTQGVLVGDLSSQYRVNSQIDTRGASLESMNGRHDIDVEAQYLGPCPAGMAAGDVMIANGMKLNMNHLRALAGALTGGG